jgi:hypothetical protein
VVVVRERPINEGAVAVSPFSSELTPVGQVMQLFSAHTGGRLVALPAAATSGDLDTVATVDGGGRLTITVSNLNAVGWRAYELALSLVTADGGGGGGGGGERRGVSICSALRVD